MALTDAMTLNRLHDDVQRLRVGCLSRSFGTAEAREAHAAAMDLLDQAMTTLAVAADVASKREPQPTDEIDAEIEALELQWRNGCRAYDGTLPPEIKDIPRRQQALRIRRGEIVRQAERAAA